MPLQRQNDRKIINSVQKAIDILNLFDRQNSELGTTEIAKILDMPKSTVAGLINTLEANGFLDQNPENRKYRLGLKLVERSSMLLSQLDLRKVALPYLEELRDWCNESVNIAIRDSAEVMYIERLFGTSMLGMRSEIGKRELAHSTALGKAILSYCSDEELTTFIAQYGLPPVTQHTITDGDQFIHEIHETQERGYAIDNEENELGGRCVAASIVDYLGQPIAAISISVPIQRFPDSKLPIFSEKVKDVAGAVSRRLGFLPHE